jgi:uncharacterized membrane protein YoaK (UPF0700 family)
MAQALRACIPLPGHPKAWLAIGLSWAAAFVDAVGWLFLYHVYTAHMTGNTASFGVDVAAHDWASAFHHSWPLVPFVLGLLFSASTTAAARRLGWHSSFSIALTAEIILLVLFIMFGSRWSIKGQLSPPSPLAFYFLLSLPTAAMGLQTVTVTRVAGLRVYTTYLTGSLAKFAEAVAHYGFWFRDRTRGRFRKRVWRVLRVTPQQKYAQHALLTAGLWIAYFIGAVCGALLKQRYNLVALLCPCAVLLIATVIDILRPVAAADEPRSWDDS